MKSLLLVPALFLISSLHSDLLLYGFFFFFQAEDGIRDLTVTGVQTCALPISRSRYNPSGPCGATHKDGGGGIGVHSTLAVVDINDGTRRAVQALRANIANDANNCG